MKGHLARIMNTKGQVVTDWRTKTPKREPSTLIAGDTGHALHQQENNQTGQNKTKVDF